MKWFWTVVLVVATGSLVTGAEDIWQGPKLKPVPREEVYQFTRKPSFAPMQAADGTPVKDRYQITFASRGYCDVAVAIEDPKGKIIRHIVYGVLGANAPAPLKTNALEQTLIWDGKDDFGNYVSDAQKCVARVSLGLNPTFDRIIGWHPKDTIGPIIGIGTDPEGVYVISAAGYWKAIKMYDHDGNYVRTIHPPPADKLEELKGMPLQEIPGQTSVPVRDRYGTILPYLGIAYGYTVPVVSKGRIAFCSHASDVLTKRIFRVGTDGSTGGETAEGPVLARKPGEFSGPSEIAASPDGKWLYVTKLGGKLQRHGMHVRRHAVHRIAWDDKGPLKKPFIGEDMAPGEHSDQLNTPEGIDCDRKGNIYVSDHRNNRIQVFTPEGDYFTTIPAKWPRQICVHQKTGEIYYTSFGPEYEGAALVKLSPLPEAKEIARLDLASIDLGEGASYFLGDFKSTWSNPRFRIIFSLDSWATPTKVWLVPMPSRITIWADRGDKFELVDDFDKDIRADGYTPHAYNGYKMNRIQVDPVRGHLYYLNSLAAYLLRCDPEVGKGWNKVLVPASGWRGIDGFQLGYDGYLYMRTPLYLARFDPDHITPRTPDWRTDANLIIPASSEIPFDYGEEQAIGYGGKHPFLRGVIKLPAQIRGNGFDMGMGVAPNGNILAICQNYQEQSDRYESKGTTVPKLFEDRYRPIRYPGRLWYQGGLIWVWDKRGQLIGEDVIRAMHGASCGVRSDKDGNIYVGLAAHPLKDGVEFLPARHTIAGPGALLKFPATGGKAFGTWSKSVPLKDIPNRPPEFTIGRGGYKLWTQNLLWSYPGMSTMTISTNTCTCPQSRFDTDVYGRSFIPESWRYSVGVCDTNGNPITHIGRYGNMDSGQGPQSPVPVAGGIAFSQCDFVTTLSDRWLYVADTGNWRVVRIKLGYHQEAVVPLQ